jgi:hypothetical protein
MGLSTIAYTQPLAYLVTPLLFLGPHYGYYLDGVLPGQSNFDGITFGPIEQRNYFMAGVLSALTN